MEEKTLDISTTVEKCDTREVLGTGDSDQEDRHFSDRPSWDDEEAQEKIVSPGRLTNQTIIVASLTDSLSKGLEEKPEHEIELQQEILNVIGPRLETDKKTAAAVHKDVSLRWSEILKKGLPSVEIKILLDEYPAPENCTFITVPKLNAEITAAIQETAIKRDKRIVKKQARIAAGLAAVGRAISFALRMDGSQKIELLEYLSDGGRLLASIHREESLARKSFILSNLNSALNSALKTTLSNTSVDE